MVLSSISLRDLRRALAALCLAGLLVGCAAPAAVQQTQRQLQQVQGSQDVDVQSMSQYLGEYRKNGEDEVLYHLEKGMLHHLNQDWKKSSTHFQRADRAIRKNYTKSINRNVQSLIANDFQLSYDGESYEDVYLNVFQCLNYLNNGEFDEALVEARQFNRELEFISDKYKGLASSLSPDTAQTAIETADQELPDTMQTAIERVDQELEDVRLLGERDGTPPLEIRQNSALARFLATVLYAKDGSIDDAEIELNNLRAAVDDQGQADFLSALSTHSETQSRIPPAEALTNPRAYNTLLVAFHGNAPRKEEKRYQFRFEIDDEQVQLDFAVPVLLLPGTQVEGVRAIIDRDTLHLPVVEEMHETAKAMFEDKKPIVYTRAVIRSFLRATATEAGQAGTETEGEEAKGDAEWLVQHVGEHASQYLDRADTRGWQTMPGVSRSIVARLPSGSHDVTFQYLAYDGTVLQERTRRIRVDGTSGLAIGESFFLR